MFTRRLGVPVVPGWSGFPETVPLLLAATRGGEPVGAPAPQVTFTQP